MVVQNQKAVQAGASIEYDSLSRIACIIEKERKVVCVQRAIDIVERVIRSIYFKSY